MANGKFPIFEEHLMADCIDGHGLLTGHRDSGFPPRYGQHRAFCPVCGRSTFYDLRADHPAPSIYPRELDKVPTWITPERALEIWKAKGPAGDFTGTCSAHENAEIHRVWRTLRGGASWADALLSISQGRHPFQQEEKP